MCPAIIQLRRRRVAGVGCSGLHPHPRYTVFACSGIIAAYEVLLVSARPKVRKRDSETFSLSVDTVLGRPTHSEARLPHRSGDEIGTDEYIQDLSERRHRRSAGFEISAERCKRLGEERQLPVHWANDNHPGLPASHNKIIEGGVVFCR